VIKIIFIDPQLNIVPADHTDLILDDQVNYVAGYDQIVRAIHKAQPYAVLVKEKKVFRWLRALGEKYGKDDVVFEERNLRLQLLEQIGIPIPENITDQQIIDAGLLDLKIPAEKNTSFEDYVLQVFIGDFILTPSSIWKIGDIASRYDPEQWKKALSRQLVRDIYYQRLKYLRGSFEKLNRKAELQILDWLEDSPEVVIKNLFALKILADYPQDIGIRVLGKNYPHLFKLNLDLRKTPVTLDGNQKLVDEISLYLEKRFQDISLETFQETSKQISGFLEVEFEFVQRILIAGDIKVNDQFIRKMQRKFKPLQSSPKFAQALGDLDLLISRERPSIPDTDFNESQWITWATQEYLPYRFWLENINRLDDQIAEIANSYADWLYNNYNNLLFHSDHMAWKALLNLKDQIKQHTGPTLVILVDNLNTKFYPDLRTHLQQNGFYEHEISYCFSNLPSCTEVSKKSIITGHYAPFKETAYNQSVTNIWNKRLGKKVRYLANIGEFRSVQKQDADVYFLNYIPLDITLHLSELQTGISHTQAIRNYISALAQDVQSFAKKLSAERDLLLIIASDHGSTRIPKDGVNVIKGDYYKKKALDEHHRYIEVSDTEADLLKQSPNYECYLFDKDLLELSANYLVARRLYHFRPLDESIYVHGGLTPEETIVPVAIYKPVTISATPLDITLVGNSKIYIGTKIELFLEVTNLNNYSCEEISIEVIDQNFDAEPIYLEVLPQLRRTKISTVARCLRTADRSANSVKIRTSFQFLGKPFEQVISILVELVDPAKAKIDLNNI